MRRLFLFLLSRPGFASLFLKLRKVANLGLNYNAAARYGIQWTGERGALASIARRIEQSEEFVLCDIGAAHGDYAEMALALLPKQTKVYCFEPTKKNSALLRERFSSDRRVEIIDLALGDRQEESRIHYPWEGGNAAIDLEAMELMISAPIAHEAIRIDTLDNWIERHGMSRIDMLKIDVEGFELRVLRGAKNALEKLRIRFIQLEFGVGSMIQRTYFRDFWTLLSRDYRFHLVLNRGLLEITEYNPDWENFQTANFLLTLR